MICHRSLISYRLSLIASRIICNTPKRLVMVHILESWGELTREKTILWFLLYAVANRDLMALMPGLQITLISLRAQAQGQLLQPFLQPHIHFLVLQMDPQQIVLAKQKISSSSTLSMARKYLQRKKTLFKPGTLRLCEWERKKQEERNILIQINFLVVDSKSESFLDGLKHLIVQGVEKVLEYKYRPSRLSEKVDEQLGKIRLADTLTNVLVPAYDIQHLKLVTFSSHQVINFFTWSSISIHSSHICIFHSIRLWAYNAGFKSLLHDHLMQTWRLSCVL